MCDYWYENRDKLEPGMVFTDCDGGIVQLDRRVPGDGTKWYVAIWSDYAKGFLHEDDTLEPGDLVKHLGDEWPAPQSPSV